MYDCRHNRARTYHVKQRALYTAIGEADSKLRRPLTLNHAIHRLMVLDAIVEDPDLVWLGTAEEKAAHLTALTGIAPRDLPQTVVGHDDARTVPLRPLPSHQRGMWTWFPARICSAHGLRFLS